MFDYGFFEGLEVIRETPPRFGYLCHSDVIQSVLKPLLRYEDVRRLCLVYRSLPKC